MADDEYEIMPHSSIDKLKADLEALKSKTSSDSDSKDTLKAVKGLNDSINDLLKMFKVAAEEMKIEEAEAHGVEKKLGPLAKKVDMLIEQNEELAKGIVVIADMLKDHVKHHEEGGRSPQGAKSMPPPPMMGSAPKQMPPSQQTRKPFSDLGDDTFGNPDPLSAPPPARPKPMQPMAGPGPHQNPRPPMGGVPPPGMPPGPSGQPNPLNAPPPLGSPAGQVPPPKPLPPMGDGPPPPGQPSGQPPVAPKAPGPFDSSDPFADLDSTQKKDGLFGKLFKK